MRGPTTADLADSGMRQGLGGGEGMLWTSECGALDPQGGPQAFAGCGTVRCHVHQVKPEA